MKCTKRGSINSDLLTEVIALYRWSLEQVSLLSIRGNSQNSPTPVALYAIPTVHTLFPGFDSIIPATAVPWL